MSTLKKSELENKTERKRSFTKEIDKDDDIKRIGT
jgi:hypothetical protein